jgi:hypothetical protein
LAKSPSYKKTPKGAKEPATGDNDPDVLKHLPLSWGLKRLDMHAPCEWSWLNLDATHLEELHRELAAVEGEKLFDLLRNERVKEIPAEHMTLPAQKRLKELRLEEEDSFWEIRMPSKRRAWGIMRGATFSLLWWDVEETACNPPPKGTRRR